MITSEIKPRKGQREKWSSTTGFIIAGLSSAIGLGTLIRFPYIVGKNGGGAFLIPYFIAVAFFGIPLLILEYTIGKHFKNSMVPSFNTIGKRFKWVGLFTILVSCSLLSYYLAITGWVLAYFLLFISGKTVIFSQFTDSYYPLLFFFMSCGIAFLVIRAGIKNGIERVSKIFIPLLFAILVFLLIYALLLPGAALGIKFYLTPDFSKITSPSVWTEAFGQAFYSLSIGLGIMITYGSYIKEDIIENNSLFSNVEISSATIATFTTLAAIMGGFIIFPIVFSFGINPDSGLRLAFITLPLIFQKMNFGYILGAIFFLLLFIAAISSSISLLEVIAATFIDCYDFDRKKATLAALIVILILGLPSALSYTSIKLEMFGKPLLDLYDSAVGMGVIFAGLFSCIVAGWFMEPQILIKEILGSKGKQSLFKFIIKLFIPLVLIIILVARLATMKNI